MAFREVRVFEIREVLRLWLSGEGLRGIERLSQVDRKTVRRYLTAAERLGVVRDGGVDHSTTCSWGWWWKRCGRIAATVTGRRGDCSPTTTTTSRVGSKTT